MTDSTRDEGDGDGRRARDTGVEPRRSGRRGPLRAAAFLAALLLAGGCASLQHSTINQQPQGNDAPRLQIAVVHDWAAEDRTLRISLVGPAGGDSRQQRLGEVEPGDTNTFRVDELPPGTYRLEAEARGPAPGILRESRGFELRSGGLAVRWELGDNGLGVVGVP